VRDSDRDADDAEAVRLPGAGEALVAQVSGALGQLQALRGGGGRGEAELSSGRARQSAELHAHTQRWSGVRAAPSRKQAVRASCGRSADMESS
jgi:hypothetical protein